MIDASPSLEAAKGISGKDLLAYLNAEGWIAGPSKVVGVMILSKHLPESNEHAEFILPIKPGFSDEGRRVADALRTIAQIQGCSEAQIAKKVQQKLAERTVYKVKAADVTDGQDAEALERRSISAVFVSGNRGESVTNETIKIMAQLVRKSLGLSDQKSFNIVELLENEMPKEKKFFFKKENAVMNR